MTVDVAQRFADWKRTLSDVDSWSHCGRVGMHGPHVHDIITNEGAHPECQCVGTPDLTLPDTPPPTLEIL